MIFTLRTLNKRQLVLLLILLNGDIGMLIICNPNSKEHTLIDANIRWINEQEVDSHLAFLDCYTVIQDEESTLREESSQTNVILHYRLLTAISVQFVV